MGYQVGEIFLCRQADKALALLGRFDQDRPYSEGMFWGDNLATEGDDVSQPYFCAAVLRNISFGSSLWHLDVTVNTQVHEPTSTTSGWISEIELRLAPNDHNKCGNVFDGSGQGSMAAKAFAQALNNRLEWH